MSEGDGERERTHTFFQTMLGFCLSHVFFLIGVKLSNLSFEIILVQKC
jgi:hypothetical protein